VHELFQDINQLVVAQGEGLGLPARMLDDVHELALDRLAFLAHEPAPADPVQGGPVGVVGLHGDQGVIKGRVGHKQRVGVEPEAGAHLHPAGQVLLIAKFRRRGRRLGWGLQHMMVGQQQPRGDQEPGPVLQDQSAGILDHDPRDRSSNRHPKA
jgi:hypothetical protein